MQIHCNLKTSKHTRNTKKLCLPFPGWTVRHFLTRSSKRVQYRRFWSHARRKWDTQFIRMYLKLDELQVAKLKDEFVNLLYKRTKHKNMIPALVHLFQTSCQVSVLKMREDYKQLGEMILTFSYFYFISSKTITLSNTQRNMH